MNDEWPASIMKEEHSGIWEKGKIILSCIEPGMVTLARVLGAMGNGHGTDIPGKGGWAIITDVVWRNSHKVAVNI